MLIYDWGRYIAIFEVVEDFIVGKITTEQALRLLESRYNTELERIRVNEQKNPGIFHIVGRNGKLYSIRQNDRPKDIDTGMKIGLLELYKSQIEKYKDCFNDCKAEILKYAELDIDLF